MIIAQVVAPGASEYERKCQRIDAAALAESHDVRTGDARGADVVHTYGRRGIVTSGRFVWRKFRRNRAVTTPLKESAGTFLPEAVDERWFGSAPPRREPQKPTIGTFRRASVAGLVERTLSRIHRFRDDIDWLLFDEAPEIEALCGLDAWIDPAMQDDDFDGFTSEALVAGVAVVAVRTPVNHQRLEQGRTGFLVPPNDPNELTHAILAALFKPELRQMKIAAARQTAAKFRPRQRLKALTQLYESIR